MVPYSSLIHIDKSCNVPVFIQIAQAITAHIRNGTIAPGARLPGTRALAEVLGVHRKTVIAAYEELLAQGWLITRSSSGTFVNHKLPEIKPESLQSGIPAVAGRQHAAFPVYDDILLHRPVLKGASSLGFDDGFPDVRIAPWDALSRAFRTVVRQGYRKNLFFYGDLYGEHSLRATMAEYLRETRGLPVTEEQVMIGRGSTMGIYLAAHVVLKSGDTVLVGEIGYGSANVIFQQTGAQLHQVPVDHAGLDVDVIADICRQKSVKMVYITPHHHYPTTVTMPAERRIRLLQLAEQYGFCILEDDYDYDFHYNSNPVMPLAGADTHGHVIYVGSLCKAISPALRVGYVAAPVDVIEAMGRLRRIIDRQGDNLTEAALAILFKEGEIKRHLKKAQKTYHHRRDIFCDMLKKEIGDIIEFTVPTGGMAVWAKFDTAIDLPDLALQAAAKGLYIANGTHYAPGMNATRMGFAAVNESEMEQGVVMLKSVIKK